MKTSRETTTSEKAKNMLKHLKPYEDWSRDAELMKKTRETFGDPRAFYDWFRGVLEQLAGGDK